MAALLGRPLGAWQAYVAQVAGELLPNGRMAYPVVVLVVPRRAGKTVLVQAVTYERCLGATDVGCWYTAQRREAAAAVWRDEWFPRLERSPLHRIAHVRRSNGSEAITFAPRALDSRVRIMAPDGEAMRGHDANVVVADEARALTLEAGRALEAAARPAQLICPDRQLYVVSSAGTDASGWLMSWRDLGRALVDAGDTTGGVAYFEWARGDDDDPTDPATWVRAHPGIGEHIDADALAVDAATMDLVAFDNEFLGAWPSTLELEPVPRVAWAACADPTAAPVAPAGELLSWALEVAPDRSATSIVAAAPTGDGRVAAELVVYRAGTVGVADELERLVGEHGARAVWVDPSSPAGSLVGELERRRVPLQLVDGRRITAASAGLRDDLVAGVVAVRPHPALDAASAAAVRRRVGEAWAYARLEAVGDPGPLVALALAVFDAHV